MSQAGDLVVLGTATASAVASGISSSKQTGSYFIDSKRNTIQIMTCLFKQLGWFTCPNCPKANALGAVLVWYHMTYGQRFELCICRKTKA